MSKHDEQFAVLRFQLCVSVGVGLASSNRCTVCSPCGGSASRERLVHIEINGVCLGTSRPNWRKMHCDRVSPEQMSSPCLITAAGGQDTCMQPSASNSDYLMQNSDLNRFVRHFRTHQVYTRRMEA